MMQLRLSQPHLHLVFWDTVNMKPGRSCAIRMFIKILLLIHLYRRDYTRTRQCMVRDL